MNQKRLCLCLITLIVAQAPAGIARSQEMSFRGLTSSSKTSDVLKAFPKAEHKNYCHPGETVQRSADGETSCDELEQAGYDLDGTTYDATFIFSTDGRLRYISLLKEWGAKNIDPISLSELNSKFNSLIDLLSSKYGPATEQPFPGFFREGAIEWQPGRGTKWQSGGDRIKISTDRVKEVTPGKYWASLQIFYTFSRRNEFDKF